MVSAGTVPVWTSNRGTTMMVKVALAQSGRTPVFVNSLDELVIASQAPDCQCVIAGIDELAQAGVTQRTVSARLKTGQNLVFLASGQAIVDVSGAGVRVVRVPFSATELRQAVEAGDCQRQDAAGNAPSQPPADITALVKAEIDRIVREKAEVMVAEAVMKIVPELAEVMIKAELQRLLAEEGDRAVSDEPPADEDDPHTP